MTDSTLKLIVRLIIDGVTAQYIENAICEQCKLGCCNKLQWKALKLDTSD